MNTPAKILVTGATGKVGQDFLGRLLADPGSASVRARAVCHNRVCPAGAPGGRDRRYRGARVCRRGDGGRHPRAAPGDLQGDARTIMDVAVKGLFWLLEECRASPTFRQFILIGGDAGDGPFLLPAPDPGDRDTEAFAPTRAATRSPRCWKR